MLPGPSSGFEFLEDPASVGNLAERDAQMVVSMDDFVDDLPPVPSDTQATPVQFVNSEANGYAPDNGLAQVTEFDDFLDHYTSCMTDPVYLRKKICRNLPPFDDATLPELTNINQEDLIFTPLTGSAPGGEPSLVTEALVLPMDPPSTRPAESRLVEPGAPQVKNLRSIRKRPAQRRSEWALNSKKSLLGPQPNRLPTRRLRSPQCTEASIPSTQTSGEFERIIVDDSAIFLHQSAAGSTVSVGDVAAEISGPTDPLNTPSPVQIPLEICHDPVVAQLIKAHREVKSQNHQGEARSRSAIVSADDDVPIEIVAGQEIVQIQA
ncbi:hypothetical protein QAD02_022442 [Eretmocerus hayati]|uniref:Uncharacterized protein n=1 Tax=Eretmocerus hayati TaxID=131215 RepID=A0ACC2PT36_9HYME|nr:hypothetical protein QAD02_022442 [Eretmocerus hayati]